MIPSILSTVGFLVVSASSTVASHDVRPSPFSVQSDSGELVELSRDGEAWEGVLTDFERGALVDWIDFPLTLGRSVDLRLRPVKIQDEGAGAIVVTPEGMRRVAPTIAMFAGSAIGEASQVFIGLSQDMVHGYLQIDGETFFLSSGPSDGPNVVTLVEGQSLSKGQWGSSPWCRTLGSPSDKRKAGGSQGVSPGTGGIAGGMTQVRLADTFIEGSPDYVDLFAGAPDPAQAAVDYAALLFTASSEIFRRDLGSALIVPDGWIRVWTTTPPWGDTNLLDVQQWWDSDANPDRDLPRASVHILDAPAVGGVAWLDAICSNEIGYAYSTVNGFFPYPIEHTSDDNWDLLVVSHELGHNWGSIHTFDYSPPIACRDGSGPDKGTIMGYCHQNHGGVANVGMRFHARVQEVIRTFADSVSCLDVRSIDLGDYDYDGIVEPADLAVLDQCLNQGFHSEGCVETFDMNADGTLDDCDRVILAAIIDGAGDATWTAYGTGWPGTNGIPALTPEAPPQIGTELRIQVENSRGLDTTGVLLLGLATASVDTGLGGTLLVSISATHPIAIPAAGLELVGQVPCDGDITGITIYGQVLQSDAGASDGVAFTAGVELVLGV